MYHSTILNWGKGQVISVVYFKCTAQNCSFWHFNKRQKKEIGNAAELIKCLSFQRRARLGWHIHQLFPHGQLDILKMLRPKLINTTMAINYLFELNCTVQRKTIDLDIPRQTRFSSCFIFSQGPQVYRPPGRTRVLYCRIVI